MKYVYIQDRLEHYVHVYFVPDVTINCDPPYVAGNPDSLWVRYSFGRKLPATFDKTGWERKIGMRIRPLQSE